MDGIKRDWGPSIPLNSFNIEAAVPTPNQGEKEKDGLGGPVAGKLVPCVVAEIDYIYRNRLSLQ